MRYGVQRGVGGVRVVVTERYVGLGVPGSSYGALRGVGGVRVVVTERYVGLGVSWGSLRSSHKMFLACLAVDVRLIALIAMSVCTPQTAVVSGTPKIPVGNTMNPCEGV